MGIKFKKRFFFMTTMVTLLMLIITTSIYAVNYPTQDSISSAYRALGYLRGQQADDGGFPPDYSGREGATASVIMSIASAGQDPNSWIKNGKSPYDFIKDSDKIKELANESKAKENAGKIAKGMILPLICGEKNPKDFAGYDWIKILNKGYNASTGQFGDAAVNHMWSMLALEAAGEVVPALAISWLKNNQENNGSWAWDQKGSTYGGDTNDTALAIQTLIACGEKSTSDSIKKAISYLHTQQNDDGGFSYQKPSPYGTDTDTASTSWVIQGLLAAGEDISADSWEKNNHSPIDALLKLQLSSGAFRYMMSTVEPDFLSTYQAVPTLMGKTFPIELVKLGVRLAGETRYETAVEISNKGWPDGAESVVISRGDLFPDALAGASLAGKLDSPILLTNPYSLNKSTKDEINRLKAKKVIILGTADAVSDGVIEDIKLGCGITNFERIGGETRYETASQIAQKLKPLTTNYAIIATGKDYPDALSAASVSAFKQIPILLVKGNTGTIPDSTQKALSDLGIKNTLILGQADVISQSIEDFLKQNNYNPQRLGGDTRYDTCKLVAEWGLVQGMSPSIVCMANGENFPDALTLGVLAGKEKASLLLVREYLPEAIKLFIEKNKGSIFQLFFAGEDDVLSDKIAEEIEKMIGF